jgi:hypothetical protein
VQLHCVRIEELGFGVEELRLNTSYGWREEQLVRGTAGPMILLWKNRSD